MGLDRQCLRDQIRRLLIEQIVSGKLPPGERLVELSLAREFQTSQTPVREALHDLVALRMVETLPHKGVRVREVSETEMAEAYAIRGLLEEYAGLLAAERLAGDVVRLREHVAAIQAAASRRDAAGYAEHDFEFHRTVVESAGNATLLRLWDSLAFEFRTPLNMARHPRNLVEIAAEHEPVVDALAAGDGTIAGRLLRLHAESFIPAGADARVSPPDAVLSRAAD